jgi:ketosteroid isomerase-like protein
MRMFRVRALARHARPDFVFQRKRFVLSSARGTAMHVFANILKRRKGVALLALLVFAAGVPASAHNDKKSASKNGAGFDFDQYLPESKVVDQTIGEALGYWQIGNVDDMRKYYANDVVVVSGNWEPPVIGWDNFVKAYQAQRARVTAVRLERSNTFIKVNGNFAWATYQWVYSATMDGQTAEYRGHTTLVLNKQSNRWVIVLDHSSIVPDTTPTRPVPSASATPAEQPQNVLKPR